MSKFGAGQSSFLWFVRDNKNIHKIFSKIWNTEDLITSYDGFGAFRPYDLNPDWKTNTGLVCVHFFEIILL